MDIPSHLQNLFWVYVVPLLAFIAGTEIFLQLGFHRPDNLSRKQVYLMSIPVGLVLVGWLLMSASVSTTEFVGGQGILGDLGECQTTIRYGFIESYERYSIFLGILVFYGTLTPELFHMIRDRFLSNDSETPINDD